MSELERWNTRYSAEGYLFGEAPNAFLRRTFDKAPSSGGRVLSVADGDGRNGVWLAEKGYIVDTIDFSPVAVEKARALAARRGVSINAEVSDLFAWDWPEARYDIVVGIFFQFVGPPERAELFGKIKRALKPGGLVAIEGYGPKQLDYATGGPKKLENLYTEALMRSAFADFEAVTVTAYDAKMSEGEGHAGMSALVDFVGRKPD